MTPREERIVNGEERKEPQRCKGNDQYVTIFEALREVEPENARQDAKNAKKEGKRQSPARQAHAKTLSRKAHAKMCRKKDIALLPLLERTTEDTNNT